MAWGAERKSHGQRVRPWLGSTYLSVLGQILPQAHAGIIVLLLIQILNLEQHRLASPVRAWLLSHLSLDYTDYTERSPNVKNLSLAGGPKDRGYIQGSPRPPTLEADNSPPACLGPARRHGRPPQTQPQTWQTERREPSGPLLLTIVRY